MVRSALLLVLLAVAVGALLIASNRSDPAEAGAPHLTGVSAIVAGPDNTCAIVDDGSVKCWGAAESPGPSGVALCGTRCLGPVDVHGVESTISISSGVYATCAVSAAHSMTCWQQLRSAARPDLTSLAGMVESVQVGEGHACALTTSGGVTCWGKNDYGQLGNGSQGPYSVSPTSVVGLPAGVSLIGAGGINSCAIQTNGGLRCWGGNFLGNVGDGSRTDRPTPVDVSGLSSGVVSVSVGEAVCSLRQEGAVDCWGANPFGILGDGDHPRGKTLPMRIAGLDSDVVALSLTDAHACVLTSAGGVKCWGNNGSGQLGDGTGIDRHAPVDVVGLQSGVTAISAGSTHTCALTASHGVKCWGSNNAGELGTGDRIGSSIPIDVIATATDFEFGDVNCDGTVDSVDALQILQASSRAEGSLPCSEDGDMNGDARANSIDAALILQYSAGLLDEL